MANRSTVSRAAIALLLGLLIAIPTGVKSIGVCYGMQGNNLPQPSAVVNLYKSKSIKAMRLYDPNQAALQALKSSNIQLILDVPKTALQSLASNASAANDWVQENVKAYSTGVSFKYITVGNEVIPGDQARYVLPAMRNIYSALSSAGLQNQIKVSTAVATSVLGVSYPPSNGSFSSDALTYLSPIVKFLASNGAPLLVNVYPYFSYVHNQNTIKIEYALFTSPGTVVTDGQYKYQNLFDAIVDAVYAALEKVGGSNVAIVVSESGWPSAGGTAATINNAKTYNQNLINHVGQGTPRRPGKAIETYIFEMFNENQKHPAVEQNFGLFYPSMQAVYSINFT
ncbi:Glucan endo-1,3-beta-glucosidase, basic vacuolar isoform [Cocos nucifera]|uniref:Glucan endo-1,3-beta-glucosidase, basic vacuolar isoform n=1 Tax=Cocos nucifera TaxID=13894 RepID=A0A8K0I6H2_COCNU|nr:Glucan endo-1,3-beta-glucosidase, basic vacuolar isoform [Cocos nucifera]